MKGEKQPKDHVYCPSCDRPYGFIRCRLTIDGRNICLGCAVIEERNGTLRPDTGRRHTAQLSLLGNDETSGDSLGAAGIKGAEGNI